MGSFFINFLFVGMCLTMVLSLTANMPRDGTFRINRAGLLMNPNLLLSEKLQYYLSSVRLKWKEPWKWDLWQIQDFRFAVDPSVPECMLLRNRGGSKSRDGTCMAVFLGYQNNSQGDFNRVLWYSGTESQLRTVYNYFLENRYVNLKQSSMRRITLWNGNEIQLRMMTEAQAVSPRADIIFYDEEQGFDKDIYAASLGTMVGCDGKKIHMGTTELDSVLHINFKELRRKHLVREHHVNECSWTTVQKELDNFKGYPKWWIDSQLFCKWVRPGGAVFPHVEIAKVVNIPQYAIRVYGIDPNPKSGHVMVGGWYFNDGTIYIDYESIPYKNAFALARAVFNTEPGSYVELEGNGGQEFYNLYHELADLHHLGKEQYNQNLYCFWWTNESKYNRILQICRRRIIVHPRCVETISHIRSAVWDPKQPRPTLLKTPDQHYLDAFIHSCCKDDAALMAAV